MFGNLNYSIDSVLVAEWPVLNRDYVPLRTFLRVCGISLRFELPAMLWVEEYGAGLTTKALRTRWS